MPVVNVVILLLSLISGLLMLWRVPSRRILPAFLEDSGTAADVARLSVIIPAYNEEKRLEPLLESLRIQACRPLEILVVDDGSTDRTAEVAAAFTECGVRIVSAEEVGEGWVGKSRACWSGARAAAGEWLLFLDADTRLDRPDSLQRLCGAFRADGASGLLSWQPYHRTERLYESLSLVFNIIVLAGMNVFTPLGERLRASGAFGPCMLCRRDEYMAVDGHRSVRAEVLDDLAIGRWFQTHGLPVRCRTGRDTVHFRMYPEGPGSLVEGWTKNFSAGSTRIHPLILAMAILWVCGGFASTSLLVQAVALHVGASVAVPVAGFFTAWLLQFAWLARKVGRWHPLSVLLFPITLLGFVLVFCWSVICTRILHKVKWRGRDIPL